MNTKSVMILTSVIVILIYQKLTAQGWSTPVNVTNNIGIFDQKPSLDIGSAPFLSGEAAHIGYNRVDTKEIYYAITEFNRQPTTWNFHQVTDRSTTNAPNSENWDASMKVLSTGRVYVAYRGEVSGADSEIFITNNVNGYFDFLPVFVTMNSTDDAEPSLFLHGSSPHVSYVGQGGTDAANQDDEIWYDDFQTKSQLTVNGSNQDVTPSLAVDSNGKAHVAFAGIGGSGASGDKEIWYAENTTGAWVATQVSVNEFEDTNPSIWIEPSRAVHIAWQGLTDDWDIYYTNNIAAPFPNVNTRVTLEPTDEMEPSLVIDPFGDAHITYQWNVSTQQIYYTNNMGGVFTSHAGAQTLVSTSPSTNNLYPSMDIDSNNYLHLTYQGFDGADTEIYYIKTTSPVPVELASFEVTYHEGEVVLQWTTTSESNNYGFEIERSSDGVEFIKIGFVAGHGTTSEPKAYDFVDRNILTETHYYRLKQIDFDGSFSYSELLKIVVEPPSTFQLEQNYPNPFNAYSTIGFDVKERSLVIIKVYDVLGHEVLTLASSLYDAGTYQVNLVAGNLSSGIYFYGIRMGDFVAVRKMVLLE